MAGQKGAGVRATDDRGLLLLLSNGNSKSKSPSNAFQPPNGGSFPFKKGEAKQNRSGFSLSDAPRRALFL
jgi:hypothetical protein